MLLPTERRAKPEHMNLRSLHWLPVTFRVDFKVVLLEWYINHSQYIADMLSEYKQITQIIRITSDGFTRHKHHKESLLLAIIIITFKSRLKSHLFSCAFTEWALCHCSSDCFYSILFLF